MNTTMAKGIQIKAKKIAKKEPTSESEDEEEETEETEETCESE